MVEAQIKLKTRVCRSAMHGTCTGEEIGWAVAWAIDRTWGAIDRTIDQLYGKDLTGVGSLRVCLAFDQAVDRNMEPVDRSVDQNACSRSISDSFLI